MELRGACSITCEGLLSYGVVSSIICVTKNWGGVVAKKGLSVCILCVLQERKRKAFYTLRPTPTPPLQPWSLNGRSQFKDYNPTTSPHILSRDLSWSSSTSFLFCPRRHGPKSKMSWLQIQDVMAPSPRRHGPSQWALTSPLIGHIFYKRRNLPNPRAPVGS
jgi:hypothetical protein